MEERIFETDMQVIDGSNNYTHRNQSNLPAPIEEAAGSNLPIQSEIQSNTRPRTTSGKPQEIKRGPGKDTRRPFSISTADKAPSRQKKKKITHKYVDPKKGTNK
jgi:hypothetical protein